jgi:hypothetical protein
VQATRVRAHTSNIIQKLILITIHGARPDNCSIRERALDALLALRFRLVEPRLRIGRGVQVGDVYKPGDATASGGGSYAFGARYMHGVEVEIPT